MFPRHWKCEIAILTVITTVALLFFPVAIGPYSAVHGPATALLSLRVRLKIWLGMAQAALFVGRLPSHHFASPHTALSTILPPRSVPPDQIAVLRC